MLKKLLVSLMTVLSIGSIGSIGSVAALGGASASATTQAVSMSPGTTLVAAQPATVKVSYNNGGASLVVWANGFNVSSWTGCHSAWVNRQTYEICSPSFSFSTLAAPAAPTSPYAYPLTVAFFNGYSRGAISYSAKVTLAYLGDYYG